MGEETSQSIRDEFEPLRHRITELLERYNPSNANLHFALLHPDRDFFLRVAGLASEGLATVQRHSDYFTRRSIYEPWFWYDLFVVVARGSLGPDAPTTSSVKNIEDLADTLVDIAAFTQQHPGNDIWKRNHEALGNLILGFPDLPLGDRARRRAASIGGPVAAFVDETLAAVDDVREGESLNEPPRPS